MKTIHESLHHTTTFLHFFRVGEKLFDKDWCELKTYLHKGWNYVKINGKQIGVSSFPSKEGYCEPIYFNYIFGGGFMNGDNFYYDKLLNE
jgi:hypothetical protein